MDLTHRTMPNEVGLVGHDVFKSPDHNTVHVIYGDTQKQFVQTELTKELETRTGLQLVPPQSRVATSSSKGDGVVIVVVDRHEKSIKDIMSGSDSLPDRLLRKAVETAGLPDSHTLFLQMSKLRPDWVNSKLPHSTLMVYPQSDVERSQFWTTMTTMIGDLDMDLTRRAKPNNFGLVQHAVLESPDRNTVRVIYGYTNRDFVHTKLIKALETRTALQLVPSQSPVATSSSKGDGVVIVIIDRHDKRYEHVLSEVDSRIDRLLRKAVETAGHPDSHTLFLQLDEFRPKWVDSILPHSTLMVYPQSDVERTQFWTTLTTMIGDLDMDLTSRAKLNNFGLVQHAVLESPDRNTVHVIYGYIDRDFVHTELTKELETRTGLQLVPPQSPVATSSSKGDGVVIVVINRLDSPIERIYGYDELVADRLLGEAVEAAGHPDTHTLFLQKGFGFRSPWVDDKLPRSALMVYPRSDVERSQFWTTLTTMIGDPDMDLTHRTMLNEFGLVRHDVFESPDHSTVHVIYGYTQRKFVQTELTKELETRTELQLVPPQSPVATSSSKGDGVVIVVVDSHALRTSDGRFHYGSGNLVVDRLLREAMETAGHQDTHTLFLQTKRFRPDWVDDGLRYLSLMVYPEYGVGLTQFWETLTTLISEPDMDLARRAMLKPFGLVQHAVLESPDLNTVHVIYGHTNKAFAHNRLIKELVTRTGLQLVPPQSRVATSSSEGDGVVIVIVDRHDSPFTDRLLREAVETAGHPDTRTLFLQKERYCPDWVGDKLPRSTLMVYPDSDVERTQFWTTLTTMIGEPNMNLSRRAMLNDFGPVQHAVLASPDHNTVHVVYCYTARNFVQCVLTKELKTRTGLQLVPPENRAATCTSSCRRDGVLVVILNRYDALTDRLLLEAVGSTGHPVPQTLFIQERCRPDWVDYRLPPATLMVYPWYVARQSQFWTTLATMIDTAVRSPQREARL